MNENLFKYKEKTLVAVESDENAPYWSCEVCFFGDENCEELDKKKLKPSCMPQNRKDGKSVFFIEGRKHEEVKLEKRMFEDIQKDDKVFYYKKGYCKVTNVDYDSFLIEISEDTELKFNKNGKVCDSDMFPSVFWEKPKLEYITERPFNLENEMRKLQVKEWEYGVRNAFLVYWVSCKKIKIEATNIFRQIGVIYFEDDIALREFEDKIVGREISFEEFERCYKKVFLEGKNE